MNTRVDNRVALDAARQLEKSARLIRSWVTDQKDKGYSSIPQDGLVEAVANIHAALARLE